MNFWEGQPCPFCESPVSLMQSRASLSRVYGWPDSAFMKMSELQVSGAACVAALVFTDDLPRIRERMRELIDHGRFLRDREKAVNY